jgi:5'-phosphate synthase pdxT subunit
LAVGKAEVIASLNGEPVAVRQGNLFGATFHPEITGGTKLHSLFLESIS